MDPDDPIGPGPAGLHPVPVPAGRPESGPARHGRGRDRLSARRARAGRRSPGAARGQGREELKRATVLEQTSAYLEKARAAHVRARGGKGGKGGGGGVCEGGVNESMFAMAMKSVVDPASDSEPISEPDAPPPPLCLCHDTFRPDVVQLPGPDDRDQGLSPRKNPAHPGE